MSLVLPFALQWSLGGFETSSAVCLWAITSPLGALLFVGARQAVPWFVAFVGLVAFSAAIDPALAAGAPDIPQGVVVAFFALNILGVATTVFALLQYFVRARERALADLAREHQALEREQAKSERLLLNVLPEPVAARLKEQEGIIADDFPAVTVLFADIVGFTPLSERLSASELVSLLDRVFARWDALAADHGVEKIKTIGDAYMVAGGIPLPRDDHAEAIAEMALAMGPELARCSAETGLPLEVRIGIDTGPVVAGVIGRAKFIYDLWGDTVNTASRMESHALPGTIQVTERAYERLRHRFELRQRGMVEVKGKGPMTCYLLIGPRADAALPEHGSLTGPRPARGAARQPNSRPGASASAARAASRPASRARSSWWNSSRPTPIARGVMTRSACRRAASEVLELASSSTRAIVSPRPGGWSPPPARRRAGARASSPAPDAGLGAARSIDALTSTAMIGPSPSAAIVPTGRLSISDPSIRTRPSRTCGGPMIGIAMLGPTRSTSAPQRCTTSSLRRRSALAQKKLRSSSSIATVPNVRWSIASARSPRISAWRGSV